MAGQVPSVTRATQNGLAAHVWEMEELLALIG